MNWQPASKPPDQLDRNVLIVTYDNVDRPVIQIAWWDYALCEWHNMFGRIRRPVSHWCEMPTLPVDTLTVQQVRQAVRP